MRIGVLSDRTGVPVPTIKYYVREGLLPAGERTSPNQVSYGEEHARRLRLVRALVETGSLPIATVRDVLTEVDNPKRDLDGALGVVAEAIGRARGAAKDPPPPEYLHEAGEVARRHGWRVDDDKPQIQALAEVLHAFRLLGQEHLVAIVDGYAEAARIVAEADIAALADRSEGSAARDSVLETMIIGTVLGDTLFAALRRIAHIDLSGRRFKGAEPASRSGPAT